MFVKGCDPKKETARLGVLVAIFLVGQVLVGVLFGLPWAPAAGADTQNHIQAAQAFPRLSHFQQAYIGYAAFLRLGETLGSIEWFALTAQTAAVVLAARMLLSLGTQLAVPAAGWISATVYLLHPPIAQWTRYVLTETLFYASVIFLAWSFVRVSRSRQSWPVLVIALVATVTVRPNGIIAVGAVGAALAITLLDGRWKKLLGVGAALSFVVIAALSLPWLSAGGGEIEGESFLARTVKGNITFGDELRSLTMPAPSSADDSNAAYVRYIIDHPVAVARLAATRVSWELAQIRPWYSASLNAYLAVSMTAFHIFGAVGLFVTRRTHFTLLTFLLSIGWAGLIGITWAIWEGRFGWWFMVLWVVWVGVGVAHTVQGCWRLFRRGTAPNQLDNRRQTDQHIR